MPWRTWLVTRKTNTPSCTKSPTMCWRPLRALGMKEQVHSPSGCVPLCIFAQALRGRGADLASIRLGIDTSSSEHPCRKNLGRVPPTRCGCRAAICPVATPLVDCGFARSVRKVDAGVIRTVATPDRCDCRRLRRSDPHRAAQARRVK